MAASMPLTEEQLDRFFIDGYLVLQPSELTAADHRHLYDRAADLYAEARAVRSPTAHLDILGDNLRARMPEIDRVLEDPVVAGALHTILGPDHVIHPHSYCHVSSERDQPFHQDGNLPWNERGHYRVHRPDWAMLFYYPQAVDEHNGPTDVVPGTQYWTVDHERPDGGWHPGDRLDRTVDDDLLADDDLERRDAALAEAPSTGLGIPDLRGRFLPVPAGSVVLAHYDLVHRGSRTAGASDPRFMYKFYLARVAEPAVSTGSSGAAAAATSTSTSGEVVSGALGPVVAANRRWLTGGADASEPEPLDADGVAGIGDGLVSEREDRRVAAAYELGRLAAAGDQHAVDALATALHGPAEATRRAAGHGLRQAGAAGVSTLVAALGSDSAPERRPAVAALGTVATASDPGAVAALIRLLADDPDMLVRSNAAYSLGAIVRAAELDPVPVVDALLGLLEPGAEPDNAFGAGFARSTVRQSAAYGLLQALANHRLPDDRLERTIDAVTGERDRYVQGLLIEGLVRAGPLPVDAGRLLFRHLAAGRWNPTPTADVAVDPTTRLR